MANENEYNNTAAVYKQYKTCIKYVFITLLYIICINIYEIYIILSAVTCFIGKHLTDSCYEDNNKIIIIVCYNNNYNLLLYNIILYRC